MPEQESKPQNIIPAPGERNSLRWSWRRVLKTTAIFGTLCFALFDTAFIATNLFTGLPPLSNDLIFTSVNPNGVTLFSSETQLKLLAESVGLGGFMGFASEGLMFLEGLRFKIRSRHS